MKNLLKNLISISGLLFLFISQVQSQDAGVSLLISPLNKTCGSSTAVVKVIVNNYGSSSISNVPVQANITGSSTITLKDTFKKTIASGKQDTITFSTTINILSGGTFTFKVFTNLSGDVKHSNDSTTDKVLIYKFPSTPSGSANSLCGAGVLTFKAKSTPPEITFWYPNASSLNAVGSGDSLSVYASASTTYYASSIVEFSDSLKTTFAGTNNQNGNMFNVHVNRDVSIDSFDVSPLTSGNDTVYFYYIKGGYTSSNKLSSTGWTYVGKSHIYSSSGGTGSKARAVFPKVLFKSGVTYGVYIFTYGTFAQSATSKLNYTTSTGPDSAYNSDLKIYNGDGVQGLFGTGSSTYFFSPRYWNGTIFYSTPLCESSRTAVTGTVNPPVKGLKLTKNKTSKGAFNKGTASNPDEICVGDSLKYDVSTPTNFLNSEFGTKWKLSYSMATAKNTSSTNYAITNPSSAGNGAFVYLPKSSEADSTFILTVKASNAVSGCDSIFTRYIHVNEVPLSKFTVLNICQGHTTSLTNNSTPAGKINYIWDFGNGDTSSAILPVYTYGSTGTYTLSLLAFNGGCSSSSSKSVTIYNTPYGSAFGKGFPFRGQLNTGDQYDADNVCIGDTNTYTISPPKGLSNSDFGKKWSIKSMSFLTPFGNKTSDTLTKNPTSTKSFQFSFFPTTGVDSVYILKLTLQTLPGGCDTLMYRYIHVRVKPVAKFYFTNACIGSPIIFKDSSTIKIATITNWQWDFGDGTATTSENPSHNYSTAGSYKVSLTVVSEAGCGNSYSSAVTQYPRAVVKFGANPGCNGDIIGFTDSTNLSSGVISSWKWSFGDGGSSLFQNPTNTYLKSGPYTVKLVTTTGNGCKDSLSKKIRVLPKPVPQFTYLNACVGNTVYFANNSTDSLTQSAYTWDFGDGTTSTSSTPTHIFKTNGAYEIRLKVVSKNGCFDTDSQTFVPYAKPDVNVNIKPGCINAGSYFADSSKSGSSALYHWSFGDGGSENSHNEFTSHIYKKSGTFSMALTVTNAAGCVDSQRKSITISDNPKAGFTTTDVCVDKAAAFINTSTPAGVLNYIWDFGDGSQKVTSTDAGNKYSLPGTYQVKLSATNASGCSDTFKKYININAIPAIPHWFRNQVGYTVTFVPKDTNLAGYQWFFGTPTNDSSGKKIPTFTYPTADKRYGVKLVVTNKAVCSSFSIDSIGMGKYGIEEPLNTFRNVTVYPNPFEGITSISYQLNGESRVTVRITDIQGREIARLRDGIYNSGTYTDVFDASKYHAGAGLYFLKMIVNDNSYTVKIVNMKN